MGEDGERQLLLPICIDDMIPGLIKKYVEFSKWKKNSWRG
jgi:hypothetical protein